MNTKIIVNGTFDILHTGHIMLLDFAKKQGDHLLVAIDSDSRVRNLKGPTRPINNQSEREFMLRALKSVDDVTVFNTEDELIDIIKTRDLMVKGGDYRGKPIFESDYIKIIFFDVINGYSTTKKIQSIINRR